MRILILTHSFNSLTQRLHVELAELGHELSIELDINDQVTADAVTLFRPDVIVAPFLKRAIPEAVWRNHVCLVVHPGIRGDRGPSALDWAILEGEPRWGVTVLQANAEMDAGDVWASVEFDMRPARKGSLYRNEVTEAAVAAVKLALERFEAGDFVPVALDYTDPSVKGRLRPPVRQADRAIDWQKDDTACVLRKIRSADGVPGVLDTIGGVECYLYDAHAETTLRGTPGSIVAQRHGAICRATVDGAVWITHLKPKTGEHRFKRPAAAVLGDAVRHVPTAALPGLERSARETWQDIWYAEKDAVGYLHFDFYNGAMSTAQCRRLREAYLKAAGRDTRVIVLMGGEDFWSNGIHLNEIESADSPADESWENINAMNDLARAILTTGSHLMVSALQGNAGAGGVFLALASDFVWARDGVVLNPHYKSMGNLFGSEYWTYLLPRRVGADRARSITQNRLPIGAGAARRQGLIDDCLGSDPVSFRAEVEARSAALAAHPEFLRRIEDKRQRRRRDEAEKPLEQYRAEELEHMKLNFYGFDPSYHVARYNFVHKVCHSWTPLHLARHRSRVWQARLVTRQEAGHG